MDFRYELREEAKDFHRKRKAFVIMNNKLEFLPEGTTIMHYDYCKEKGMSKEEFNNITRGYYLDGLGVVFYKDNFIYDDKVISEGLQFINEISEHFGVNEFEIYFGHIVEQNFKLDYHYGKYIDGTIILENE